MVTALIWPDANEDISYDTHPAEWYRATGGYVLSAINQTGRL